MVKNLPAIAGDIRDADSTDGSGRAPGGGHGSPLQCSCLENPVDRGAWRATVRGVAESDTTEETKHAHFTPAFFKQFTSSCFVSCVRQF